MRLAFRIGFVLHLAFVVALSTLAYTGRLSVGALGHYDKIGHFMLIGLLAFFADGALERRPLSAPAPAISLGATLVLVTAGIEELAQNLSPRRTPDWLDFAADVAGVVALTWVSRRLPSVVRGAKRFGARVREAG